MMTRHHPTALVPTLGVLLALVLLAVPAPLAAQEAPLEPPDPLSGRNSYTEYCAPCHGLQGGGDGPTASQLSFAPSAFADYNVVSDLSLSEFFTVTKSGRMERMMPPWGNRLSDQEVWNTAAYAWTLHTSPEELAEGEALYAANCASCHGSDGTGGDTGIDFTDFAGTAPVSQANWQQTVAAGQGSMPAFADTLGVDEQRAVLEYVRSLSLGPMFRGELQPGAGVISGTLTNGTTNAPVAGQEVTLIIFDDTSQLESRTAQTDEAGFYRFDALPTDSGLAFAVTTEYPAGIPYGSDIVEFDNEQAALDLPLTVFETTTDASGIRADNLHHIIEFDADRLLVAELLVFSLDGDRAYTGEEGEVLRISLPPGAENLAINEGQIGDRFLLTEDGFVDTLPLPPGEQVRQILYRYSLPITGSSMDLVRSLPYPAVNVNVLMAEVGQQVESPQLANQGVRQTESGSFIHLAGQNVPAGQSVVLHLSNLPMGGGAGDQAATGASSLDPVLLAVIVGALAAGGGVLVAWPLLRRRSRGPEAAPNHEALVDALAELEEAHERGEVSDSDYRDQRMTIKAQLLDLGRQARMS